MGKIGRGVGLTTLKISCADSLELLVLQNPGTLVGTPDLKWNFLCLHIIVIVFLVKSPIVTEIICRLRHFDTPYQLQNLTNHTTNCNLVHKNRLSFSLTNFLPCLNTAERFTVEYSEGKAGPKGEGWPDIYIDAVKCPILNKNSGETKLHYGAHTSSTVMLASVLLFLA